MQPTFWIDAWKQGRRGFHVDGPNERLVAHAESVFGPTGRILVPLCGATHDLKWLADQGYEAVGVELSPIAVAELVDRDGLLEVSPGCFETPTVEGGAPLIRLLQANFFEVSGDDVGPITGIWDRAALIALHPKQRLAYVTHQRALLGDGALLLNTLSYDQSKRDGPPWSVPAEAVHNLWPEVRMLFDEEQEARPVWQKQGLATLRAQLFGGTVSG